MTAVPTTSEAPPATSPAFSLLVGLIPLSALAATIVAVSDTARRVWWLLAATVVIAAIAELAVERRRLRIGAVAIDEVVEDAGTETALHREPLGADGDAPAPTGEITTPATSLDGDAVWAPKSSHSEDENEDGWAGSLAVNRFAVADGAASAYRSGAWARELARSYVEDRPPHDLASLRAWVAGCSARWSAVDAAPAGGQPAWWATPLEERGSYATFVGIEIELPAAGSAAGTEAWWNAVAVGDSCVIQLRRRGTGYRLVSSFPIDVGSAFSSRPPLVRTQSADGVEPLAMVRTATGTVASGDLLLLATDAVAQWTLERLAGGDGQLGGILECSLDDFPELVHRARGAGEMVDDDSTLIRLRFA